MVNRIFSILIGLSLVAGDTLASEVPPARVVNPDLTTFNILAAWTQVVPEKIYKNGSPTSNANVTPPFPEIELRYVMPIPAGQTEASVCSATGLKIVGATARAKSRATLKGHTKTNNHRDSTPYKVSICQVALDQSTAQISFTYFGRQMKLYQGNPKMAQVDAILRGPGALGQAKGGTEISAVFMADTGCRGKDPDESEFGRMWQDCETAEMSSYPGHPGAIYAFDELIEQATTLKPDFAMHAGDMHYFYETAGYWFSEAGQNRFEYWLQEFLVPSQPLLLTSPFVFARGNHEQCDQQWSGKGWFALFGAGDMATCPSGADWSDTWSFDISPRNDTSLPPFSVYVVDSASPGNAWENKAFYASANMGRDKLWLTHYPAVKDEYYLRSNRLQRDVGDHAERHAIGEAVTKYCNGTIGCWPNLVLSGHQHLFQHLKVRLPNQIDIATEVIIGGHGGTHWDTSDFPSGAAAPLTIKNCKSDFSGHMVLGRSDLEADTSTSSQYGFVHLTRDSVGASKQMGWSMTTHWYPKNAPPTLIGSGQSCS